MAKSCKLFSYKAEEYAKANQDIFWLNSKQVNGRVYPYLEKVARRPSGPRTVNQRPTYYKNGSIVARPKNNK